MMIAVDCSMMWVKDRRPLLQALALDPRVPQERLYVGRSTTKDWQVPLGRRFRALKLWFTMRRFGAEGLRAHIRRSIELAKRAESQLMRTVVSTIFTPVRMGLVCFYVSFGGRELNEALLRRVNESGKIFLIHSVVDGVHFLRLAMGGLEVDDWNIVPRHPGASRRAHCACRRERQVDGAVQPASASRTIQLKCRASSSIWCSLCSFRLKC
ncbi:hypothetical protein PINS_up022130 [Pythium insidiosum]|nr:hypothetical protein PINS_up022130 [Pythium insidiosum]